MTVRNHDVDSGNSGRVELKHKRTYNFSSSRAEVAEHDKFSLSRPEHPNLCDRSGNKRIATVEIKVIFALTRPTQRIFVPLKTL